MADKMKRVPVREQDPKVRATNFEEVCYGYNDEEAREEAMRCLNCKNARCVEGCPVGINIPGFISEIVRGDIEAADKILRIASSLPAVCGRVCPQETQCEARCIRGIKGEPISIGKLERYVADYSIDHHLVVGMKGKSNGHKVAVIGSGPAGLTCAGDLCRLGYDVTVFEALHRLGGVMTYGIPEFRLPKKKVVQREIFLIEDKLGCKFETDVIVGKSVTIDELMQKEGFEAVFIGSGAGLPIFMGIPGETSSGVFSANEYLTRCNLMGAFDDENDTPIFRGKKVAVLGGGNVAMDSARTALRLGAEVHLIYRRTQEEMPARIEEVHHAMEEGVQFHFLTNIREVIPDEKNWVKALKMYKLELGEPDESGRRRPIEIPGSDFEEDFDTLIMALGTTPNPLIASTTEGLETNRKKCITTVNEFGQTSKAYVFVGGDAATGAATVILAMGAGKAAAKGIHEALSGKTE